MLLSFLITLFVSFGKLSALTNNLVQNILKALCVTSRTLAPLSRLLLSVL
jgi:hypothetical protein